MIKVEKKITFIYTDKVEYQCAEPIAEEAKKRGFVVEFSDDIFKKCEIGFYFQHLCYPKNSKFSVVMLHDLGQQHGEWPIMWKNEFWNDFSLGFLPSNEWVSMWHNASCYNFVRPKYGCYFSGWQKADKIKKNIFQEECEKIVEKYEIDRSKKTILYAPSWEWGGRQLEIIESCKDLDVNLIIKHAPWNPENYPEQVKIIDDMTRQSQGKKNVYILDSAISIFNTINISDVLISEESSTLYEAMMLDKPVIAVTDWLIPDVIPPRLPDFPYDFAIHISKNELKNTIETVMLDESYRNKIIEYRKTNFSNLGMAAKTVMDILCDVLSGNDISDKRIHELPLVKTPKEFKKTVKKRKKIMSRYFIKKKYVERYSLLNVIWNKMKYMRGGVENNSVHSYCLIDATALKKVA